MSSIKCITVDSSTRFNDFIFGDSQQIESTYLIKLLSFFIWGKDREFKRLCLYIRLTTRKNKTFLYSCQYPLTILNTIFLIWHTIAKGQPIYYYTNSTTEPQISVGSFTDLRTGGRWFDYRLGQYSFRGLIMVIATGFILSHRCPLFRQWLSGKAASGLKKNIVRSTG